MKPTIKPRKAMCRSMTIGPAGSILPGNVAETKRSGMIRQVQYFVRLITLMTMSALSSASFAVSLIGPLPTLQSCPSPLDIATLPPQLYGTYSPWLLPPGRTTICPGAVSGMACSNHYVYVPGTPAAALLPTMRTPLFLFLPGTGGEPNKYQHLLQMAAYAGYRSIGLAYDSQDPVESNCAGQLTCGSNCQGLVRDEIITGQDVTVDEAVELGDAILPRLYDLLAYLHDDDLTDGVNDYGWDAYYVDADGDPQTIPATVTLDDFVWSNIIVSGHSQGAGHAEKISVDRQVHGIIVFEGGRDTCEITIPIISPTPITLAAEWAWTNPAGGASAGRPRYALSYTHTSPFSVPATWRALGFPATAASLDALFVAIPPAKVAHTAPEEPPGCEAHQTLAIGESLPGATVNQCLPVDRTSGTAATQADDTYLFPLFLTRLCYACDKLTCP